MSKANPRWIALQILLQVLQQGRSLDAVFAGSWFRELDAEPRDLALSRELAFGLCRWYYTLSTLLSSRLQKPLRERDRDIEIILLLGLYQLLVMRTEAHAAVNETVNLVRGQNKAWARGLVNAVLRAVIRDAVELPEDAAAQDYPDWMLARISRDWGRQAYDLLTSGNRRGPLTLRAAGDADAALERLAHAGIGARRHVRISGAIELDHAIDVHQIPGFDDGEFSVQDAAAQLAAPLLDCAPGMRVLDACAAPGGKSAHLLQLYPEIQLDVLDNSEGRLQRLQQNLARIGASAGIIVGDAAAPDGWFAGRTYDRVLADVPCSASGVIRRHPDIKLLRRESDIMQLVARQRKIVDALWRLLSPGGSMLYCTCSVFKEENEIQIAKFAERHPDCRVDDLAQADWGESRPRGRQILSGDDNMDGFYYARLRKAEAQ